MSISRKQGGGSQVAVKVAGCEWARPCIGQEVAAAGTGPTGTGEPMAILYYVLDTVENSEVIGII